MEQNNKIRNPKFVILLGTNGTGKSTFAKRMIDAKLKSRHNRVFIITPHANEWLEIESIDINKPIPNFKGIRKILVTDGEILEKLSDPMSFRNGLILFDDCRIFLNARLQSDMNSMLISIRQRSVDIIAAAHGFTQMPPAFFPFANEIVLFKTKDSVKLRKNNILEFDQVMEMQKRVNDKAGKDPMNDNFHYYEILTL